MKVALLVFLFAFFTKANAVDDDKSVKENKANAVDHDKSVKEFEECLDIKSFIYRGKHDKLSGQCHPSKSPGAFYTEDNKRSWECFDKSSWPDEKQIAEKKKKGWKICKFGGFESKLKKEDIPVCKEKPLQCAPGPKINWGACVALDVANWKCIPQEDEGDIDDYVKGDCLALPVENWNGKELYNSICRFATEKDAEYPKPFKCATVPTSMPEPVITCSSPSEDKDTKPVFKSACFSTHNGKAFDWSCRKEEDQESSPCEWTRKGENEHFWDRECLLETHKGYKKALDWSPLEPAPTKTENGGIGAGWIALLGFLMLAAGGGSFLFWQRAKPTGPRELSGGLVR